MQVLLTVCGRSLEVEKTWVDQLKSCLRGHSNLEVKPSVRNSSFGQIVFLDHSIADLDSILEKLDRKGRVIFLVVDDPIQVPPLLNQQRVDDVVVIPFRPLEVESKIRYYEQFLAWSELHEINASISDVLKNLQEDLDLVERLQKAKLPKRFSGVKGFQIASRYLAGSHSGGDYFDLAESKEGTYLSILLSDASSYGLSSAVLSAIMRVTLKLSHDQLGAKGAVAETVRRIYDELLLTLKEKDHLSLFYGTISRESQKLKFINLGSSELYYAPPAGPFEILGSPVATISKANSFPASLDECEVELNPKGRLVLVSKGFIGALGSSALKKQLNQWRDKDATSLLNELTFQIKSQLDQEEMPSKDCTAIVLDVDSDVNARVVKLSKRGQDESLT